MTAFKRVAQRAQVRWCQEQLCPVILRCCMDIPRSASPPTCPILNRSKPASRKYWGEGHKEMYPAVAWHLPCGVHWVFSEGQTHSLHPHLHSFFYWRTENWDFLLHFSQYPISTGTVLQFITCCNPLRRMVITELLVRVGILMPSVETMVLSRKKNASFWVQRQ